ncbi:MAG: hypothetical protein IT190_09985 [Microbacteriaceae bacterium]|nr:hypothetical protein [Microbacteriaceae bacterium]
MVRLRDEGLKRCWNARAAAAGGAALEPRGDLAVHAAAVMDVSSGRAGGVVRGHL